MAAERLSSAVLSDEYFNETIRQAALAASNASRATIETAVNRRLSETEFQKLIAIYASVIREVLPKPKWKPMLTTLYLRSLTLEEMTSLIDFYKLPIASKLARLTADGSQAGVAMAQEHQKELGEAFLRAFAKEFPGAIPAEAPSRPTPRGCYYLSAKF